MSASSYHKRPPYYKRLPEENFIRYLRRLVTNIITMYPYAREYGFRYYTDTEFRRKISYKRKSHKKNVVRRKREGSFSNSRVKAKLKLLLVERDEQLCKSCKDPFAVSDLTIDHILPLFLGGNSHLDNLQLLCEPCHKIKSKQEHRDWQLSINNAQ